MVVAGSDRLGDADLLGLACSGDLWAAGELYDRHGAALYRLAFAFTGDVAASERTVIQAFQRACAGAVQSPRGESVWHRLAGLAFAVSGELTERTSSLPREVEGAALVRLRALYGLTLCGGYTYRQAATLLAVDAEAATRDLRTVLRDPWMMAAVGAEGEHVPDSHPGLGHRDGAAAW